MAKDDSNLRPARAQPYGTARCGPACRVVWQGRAGDRSPMPIGRSQDYRAVGPGINERDYCGMTVVASTISAPTLVDRRLVDPQPLRNGGGWSTVLPGRVHHETHTRWSSNWALPGLRQCSISPVAEERLRRVVSPLCAVHQPIPLRRMLRAAFPVSLGEGRGTRVIAAAAARLLITQFNGPSTKQSTLAIDQADGCLRISANA